MQFLSLILLEAQILSHSAQMCDVEVLGGVRPLRDGPRPRQSGRVILLPPELNRSPLLHGDLVSVILRC